MTLPVNPNPSSPSSAVADDKRVLEEKEAVEDSVSSPRQMEREMIAWRSLAQEMTPGGSEFMSRDVVREYYREFKDSRHRAKLDLLKLRNAIRAYFKVTVRSLRVMGDEAFADSMERFGQELLSENPNAAGALPVNPNPAPAPSLSHVEQAQISEDKGSA